MVNENFYIVVKLKDKMENIIIDISSWRANYCKYERNEVIFDRYVYTVKKELLRVGIVKFNDIIFIDDEYKIFYYNQKRNTKIIIDYFINLESKVRLCQKYNLKSRSTITNILKTYKDFHDSLCSSQDLADSDYLFSLLDLDNRTYNCLKKANINSMEKIEEYFKTGEIIKISGLGKKSLKDLIENYYILTGKNLDQYLFDIRIINQDNFYIEFELVSLYNANVYKGILKLGTYKGREDIFWKNGKYNCDFDKKDIIYRIEKLVKKGA